jgi:putative endonuclease
MIPSRLSAFLQRFTLPGLKQPDPDRLPLGPRGETAAARYLKKQGFRIIARNSRQRVGEIDILAESPERDAIVVVEVKARVVEPGDGERRLPERAITAAKGRKLASLAKSIVKTKGLGDRRVRIDVVAVEFERGRREATEIRHYPGAIDASGQRT